MKNLPELFLPEKWELGFLSSNSHPSLLRAASQLNSSALLISGREQLFAESCASGGREEALSVYWSWDVECQGAAFCPELMFRDFPGAAGNFFFLWDEPQAEGLVTTYFIQRWTLLASSLYLHLWYSLGKVPDQCFQIQIYRDVVQSVNMKFLNKKNSELVSIYFKGQLIAWSVVFAPGPSFWVTLTLGNWIVPFSIWSLRPAFLLFVPMPSVSEALKQGSIRCTSQVSPDVWSAALYFLNICIKPCVLSPVFLLRRVCLASPSGGAGVKNPPASTGEARDTGSIPGSGRSPGVGNGNLL